MLSYGVTHAAPARIGRGILKTAVAKRTFATNPAVPQARSTFHSHKVVVVGGGTAGLAVSHQLLRSGQFRQNDIAVIDPAEWHHYQPGWTLVGGGLKQKEALRRREENLIDTKMRFYNSGVKTFTPNENFVTLNNGDNIAYDQLVVASGINIKYDSIKGLPEALADPSSLVSTIYGYDTCDKVARTIDRFHKGNAIFTQPAGMVKCAGAPQKAMWLALDKWRRAGLVQYNQPHTSAIHATFATGLPVMFGVPKYSKKLDNIRQQRGVEGLFQHDLTAIEGNKAVFTGPDGNHVTRHFDLLHAVPKMGPHGFVARSPLANSSGLVDVDDGTTRHKVYPNVWSVGDASSLPTSKTAAAITAQAPIMVSNLLRAINGQKVLPSYDGYTSCPLTTEYGKVLLAEFKYGAEPKETFAKFGLDQGTPRRAFYYLKRDFFPWMYYKFMVKGTWAGPNGFIR